MAIIKTAIIFFLLLFGFLHFTASTAAAQKNVYKAVVASALMGMLEWAAAYAILVVH